MNLSMKVKDFAIKADSEKEAYINGCKELAKYMASRKYKNLSFKIERTTEANVFVFTMFADIDLSEERSKFCKLCKEYHCNFFVNEDYNCSRCNLKTFLERMEKKSQISANYYKSEMK